MRRLLIVALVLLAARAGADHVGTRTAGDTIFCDFTTATSTAAALSSGAVKAYKNGTTTSSTTGLTLTASRDSVTGYNSVAIDTSADGTFYSNGAYIDIVLSGGTAGGASVVGFEVCSFRLGTIPATAVTVSDKTGYSLSVTPPTAAQVASATWDEALSGHTTAGTTGKKLGDIPTTSSGLTAADVWTYTTRTLTAFDFGTDITVSNPVATDGDLTIVPGTAYKASPHSLGLSFVYASALPDLTGATPTLRIYDGDTVVTDGVITLAIAGTVSGAGTASQTLSFDLTAAQTALLTRIGADAYQHHVDVVWAADSPAQPYRLIEGSVTTRARY